MLLVAATRHVDSAARRDVPLLLHRDVEVRATSHAGERSRLAEPAAEAVAAAGTAAHRSAGEGRQGNFGKREEGELSFAPPAGQPWRPHSVGCGGDRVSWGKCLIWLVLGLSASRL